jgi:hypothetical protein
VTRLDYPGQSRREAKRQAAYDRAQADGSASAQNTFKVFVKQHQLGCFACKTKPPFEIAKIGRSKRGPWAICVPCVKKGRPA